ncbi:hypothetical protein LCGC14_1842190 [marine sediment metagenome]|uniref:Uncharacterized protein n=1 Tax=marine sediment metagenome TaxID=412755 RepID=A0A0F9ISF6_9ZZZZ
MEFIIKDATGTGKTMGVNKDNQAEVEAVIEARDDYVNRVKEGAFSVLFDATPTGADDCFFYFKNTGEDDVHIEGFSLKLAATEYIDCKLNDVGAPSGGGTLTPVNLHGGSGNTVSATIEDGNDITNLSGGSTAFRIYHLTSAGSVLHIFPIDLIVPKNGTFTMYCQTGTTALAGYIIFHTEDLA